MTEVTIALSELAEKGQKQISSAKRCSMLCSG